MPALRFRLFGGVCLIVLCALISLCGQAQRPTLRPKPRHKNTSPLPPPPVRFQLCLAARLRRFTSTPTTFLASRAVSDLAADIARVTGQNAKITHDDQALGKNAIIVGTLEKSALIKRLVQDGKIDPSAIDGKWESFFLEVVPKALPGVENALVIVGSDKRGTIYGIYDLSQQIGVSPWYYWADVPVQHRDSLFVNAGKYLQGPPAVKYRGIFLNDEAPALSGWVREKFGQAPQGKDPPVPSGVSNMNHEFYAHVFELLLRLKANYLWPAMWNNAFNEDDPENPKLADEYGIVMGTSHQEPMLRAQKEWDRRYRDHWNYYTDTKKLQDFWREGITRNKDYESIITMGLRGANDTAMIPGGTPEQSADLLKTIIADQRQIISEVVNPDPSKVPQMWCPYKEVLEYYDRLGLRVPDDVTILWTDDNWGNLRRLPTAGGTQPQRRRRHLLPLRLRRRTAKLQMDQYQSAAENLGANESRARLRRRPNLDRQRRRSQTAGIPDVVLSRPSLGKASR